MRKVFRLFGGWQIVSTGIKSVRLPLGLGMPEMKNNHLTGWNKEGDGYYLILLSRCCVQLFRFAVLCFPCCFVLHMLEYTLI